MWRSALICLYLAPVIALACDPYATKYKNAVAKLYSLEDSKAKVPRTVWGNIKVQDGCRFQVANMTIIPPGQGVYWYAIPLKTPTEEEPPLQARVVQQGLGGYNGQTVIFHLTPEANWDDIAIMLLYSEGDRRSYGAFGVNGKVKDYLSIESPGVDLQLDPTQYLSDAGQQSRAVSLWALGLVVLFIICQ